MRFVAASDATGLDPAGYRVAMPDLQNADAGTRPLALLGFELPLSAKVLTSSSTQRTAGSIRTTRPVIKDVHDRDAHLAQKIAEAGGARNAP